MKRFIKPVAFVLSLLLAVYVGTVIGYNVKATEGVPKTGVMSKQIALTKPDVYGIWKIVNQKRVALNLSPLSLDPTLNQSASAKCSDMVTKNYWSHNDPSGDTPWHFIQSSYGTYTNAGENLGYGFRNDADLVNKWMKSPEHRANIVKPQYQDVGYAVCHSDSFVGDGSQYIVVQHFASK